MKKDIRGKLYPNGREQQLERDMRFQPIKKRIIDVGGASAECLEEQLDIIQDTIAYLGSLKTKPREGIGTFNYEIVKESLDYLKQNSSETYAFYRTLFAELIPKFIAS
jgi:hypothetical protein